MVIDLKEILPTRGSWIFYNTDTAQIVDWTLDDGLIVRIILPHDLFEWFVELYSSNKIKLLNEWYEVYGQKEKMLEVELREDIHDFCDKVAANKTRFVIERRWPYTYKRFQFLKDELWIDIINNRKLKLF